ncbi:hypothetical protein BGZ94_007274 [Podila epigama]|nr:hypothetical protein BGZ94_007274 [Podila epigama]
MDTQCVPLEYLCNSTSSPCTDPANPPANPVDCLDDRQLCSDPKSLPLPSPLPSDVPWNRQSPDGCLPGNFTALSQTYPKKYIYSCPLEANNIDTPVDCEDWEYAYRGSCYLSTCGQGILDCLPGFTCQKAKATNAFGICVANGDPNPYDDDDTSNTKNKYDSGGSAGQYSSKDYLVQGLLIGVCCLILGVGLGVGFWHYRMKRTSRSLRRRESSGSRSYPPNHRSSSNRSRNSMSSSAHQRPTHFNSTSTSASSSTMTKRSSWMSRIFGCGKRRRSSVQPRGGYSDRSQRDSIVDTESQEGDENSLARRSSSIFVTGRWRWGHGGSRMIPHEGVGGNLAMLAEMDPPPMYQNGPELPTYCDSTEDIVMTSLQNFSGLTQQSREQPANAPLVVPTTAELNSGEQQGPASQQVNTNRSLSGTACCSCHEVKPLARHDAGECNDNHDHSRHHHAYNAAAHQQQQQQQQQPKPYKSRHYD